MKNFLRNTIGIRVIAVVVVGVLGMTIIAAAGSLTPGALPGATMHTLGEIYSAIVGTFDSSGVVANQNGSLLQNLKYIESNLGWASSSNNVWNMNSGNIGIGTSNPTVKFQVVGSASVSVNFEVGGYTSASLYVGSLLSLSGTGSNSFAGSLAVTKGITANSYQGAGLTPCTGSQFLHYIQGQFSCGTVSSSGTFVWKGLSIASQSAGPFKHVGSLSFDANTFVLSAIAASNSTIRLNWVTGPASKALANTWAALQTFTSGASFSAGAEFASYASASRFVSSGVTSNSFAGSLNLARSLTVANSVTAGSLIITGTSLHIGTSVFTALATFTNASASAAEFTSYASASKFFGAGLATCSGTNFLQYSNGTFSCTAQSNATAFTPTSFAAKGLSVGYTGGTFQHSASLSFDANQFVITNTASLSAIKLNWTTGPASRSIAQTITGAWTFSNASNQFTQLLEVGVTSTSQFFGANLSTCSGSQFLQYTSGLFSCGTVTPTNSFTGLLMGEGTTTATHITQLTFDANAFKFSPNASNGFLTLDYGPNGVPSRSFANTWLALNTFSGGASFSQAAEFTSYASASQYFGAGLGSCTGTAFLQYAGGQFSCATPVGGSSGLFSNGFSVGLTNSVQLAHVTSIAFDANSFAGVLVASGSILKLNWGVGGVASRAQSNTWLASNLFSAGASVSDAFEITSTRTTTSVASISATSLTAGGSIFNVTVPVNTAGTLFRSRDINGLALFQVSGLGAASVSDALEIKSNRTTGAVASISANSLTSGFLMSLRSTGTLGTGTASGSMLNIAANSVVGANIASISANGLTTGTLFFAQANALTRGFLMNLRSAATAITTGAVLNVAGNSTTTGTIASMSANAMTSGNVMTLSANVLTSGRVLNLRSNASAITGSVLNIAANNTTTGTIASISGNALQSGKILALRATSVMTGAAFTIATNGLTTGSVASLSANALTSGFMLNLRSAGTLGTGTASGSILNIAANSVANAVIASISANGLTKGNILRLSTTGTIVTPGAVFAVRANSLTTGSVASLSATGLATGGNVFGVTVAAAAAGNVFQVKNTNNTTLLQFTGLGTASISGGLEVSGYASISGATTYTGLAAFSGGALFSGTAGSALASLEVTGNLAMFDQNASVSGNIEVAGTVFGTKFGGPAFPNTGTNGCSGSGDKLLWSSITSQFICGGDSGGSGNGGGSPLTVKEGSLFRFAGISSLSFEASMFNVVASGSNDVVIRLDWINGPASRSTANVWSGVNTFSAGASISNSLEVAGFASISGNLILNSSGATGRGQGAFTFRTNGSAERFDLLASTSVIFSVASTGYTGINTIGRNGTMLRINDTGNGAATSSSFALSANAQTVGTIASISANSLSSGNGLMMNANALTSGFMVNLRTTAAAITGAVLNISAQSTTTGTIASISANAMTSGNVMTLNANGLTSGRVLNLRSNASAITGSVLNIAANTTTSGTIASISANGLTSGKILALRSTGAITGVAFTIAANGLTSGSVASLSANALTSGFMVNLRTTATAITGAVLNISANATTTGTIASVSANALTTGTMMTLNANSLTSGFMLNLRSTSTLVAGTASGSMLNIAANSATGATIASISANGLTRGTMLRLFSSGAVVTPGAIFVARANGLTTGVVASLSATSLSGGSMFQLTIPDATGANRPHGIMLVQGPTGTVVASWSLAGRLAIADSIISRGATSNCAGVNNPSTGCLDYAESYGTTASLSAGDVVMIDPANPSFVTIASGSATLIGVIATNPGVLIGGGNVFTGTTAAERTVGMVPVAMAGRVPVKLSLENGPVFPGDRLTGSATKPGYAAKATELGMTIGVALEFKDPITCSGVGGCTVLMQVGNTYWIPTDGAAGNQSQMASQNNGLFAMIVGLFQRILGITFSKDLVQVKKIQTQTMCLDDVCLTRDQLKSLMDRARIQAPPPTPVPTADASPTETPQLTPLSVDTGEPASPSVSPVTTPTPSLLPPEIETVSPPPPIPSSTPVPVIVIETFSPPPQTNTPAPSDPLTPQPTN